MSENYDVLQEVGLTKTESTVYIECLKLGLSSAGKIADEARLPRTTVNSALKSLNGKGILSYVIKAGVRYFSAVSPRLLIERLHEREQRLKELVPALQDLQRAAFERPRVEFYEGPEGFKTAAEDLIKTPNITIYGIVSARNLEYLPVFHLQFRRKRKERKIRLKMLTTKSHTTLELQKNDKNEFRQTRFAPSTAGSDVSIFVYDNKIAYFLAVKRTQLGIIIENKEIAQFQKRLFERLWKP